MNPAAVLFLLLVVSFQQIQAGTRGERAYQLAAEGRQTEALRNYEQALSEAQARDDLPAQARYRVNMALIYLDQGNTEQGKNLAQRSYSAYRQLGDPEGLGMCHIAFARFMLAQGRPDSALVFADSAQKIFAAAKKKAALSMAQNERGVIFIEMRQLDSASTIFERLSRENRKRKRYKACASNLNNLGRIHILKANWTDAQKFLQEAILMDEKSGSSAGKCIPLAHLSYVFARQGQCTDALFYLNRALALGVPESLRSEIEEVQKSCPGSD